MGVNDHACEFSMCIVCDVGLCSLAVSLHCVLPASAGLFQRVILHSGSAFQGQRGPALQPAMAGPAPVMRAAALEAVTAALAAQVGCTSLACAQQLPVATLLSAQATFNKWYPVMDGDLLTNDPLVLLYSSLAPVDILFGGPSDPGLLLVPRPLSAVNSSVLFPPYLTAVFGPDVSAKIVQQYPTSPAVAPFAAAAAALGDFLVTCPTRRLATVTARARTPLNVFQFDFQHSPSWVNCSASSYFCALPPGVPAFTDIPFVFGNAPPGVGFSAAEQALVARVQASWVTFAATGAPAAAATWSPWTEAQPAYVGIATGAWAVGSGYRASQCLFWDQITPGWLIFYVPVPWWVYVVACVGGTAFVLAALGWWQRRSPAPPLDAATLLELGDYEHPDGHRGPQRRPLTAAANAPASEGASTAVQEEDADEQETEDSTTWLEACAARHPAAGLARRRASACLADAGTLLVLGLRRLFTCQLRNKPLEFAPKASLQLQSTV